MSKKSNLLFILNLLILSILKEKDCYGYEQLVKKLKNSLFLKWVYYILYFISY